MAKKIFIAATRQNCGKTTTCIGLMHLAMQKYDRVGFIKPLGPKPATYHGHTVDKDTALIAQVFDLKKDLRWMSPFVVHPDTTHKVVDGVITPEKIHEQIKQACSELEKKCDLIIIEGSGHPGVGSVMKTSNAHIARMLDAPVLMVTGGGLGNVVDDVYMGLALFEKEGVIVRGVLANKLIPEKRDRTLDYLGRALADEHLKVIGGFDYYPVLANPTLRRISRLLDMPLQGNKREMGRIINHVQIGAASTQRVTELIQDSSLLIVTSSRDELLVTLANLYKIPAYRSLIVGLVIPGVAPVSTITQMILDRSNIPYMRTKEKTTAELYGIITDDVSKITADDSEKLSLICSLAEMYIDFEILDGLF
ncbi:MAG TPA: AAA family ATPase [Desulfuromonadales bacterium]|nr:AAA family ATPase [Desulfuromonadales bacterium]